MRCVVQQSAQRLRHNSDHRVQNIAFWVLKVPNDSVHAAFHAMNQTGFPSRAILLVGLAFGQRFHAVSERIHDLPHGVEEAIRCFRNELLGSLPHAFYEFFSTLLHAVDWLVEKRFEALAQAAHELRRIPENVHSADERHKLKSGLQNVVVKQLIEKIFHRDVNVLRDKLIQHDRGLVQIGDQVPGHIDDRFDSLGDEKIVEKRVGDRVLRSGSERNEHFNGADLESVDVHIQPRRRCGRVEIARLKELLQLDFGELARKRTLLGARHFVEEVEEVEERVEKRGFDGHIDRLVEIDR